MSKAKNKTTTIQVYLDVKEKLEQFRRGRDSYNDVIRKLIQGTQEVYVEFILVDNELPQLHTVVFQLGEDADSLYYYDGKQIKPITLEETQELMKKPKATMTITPEEAHAIANDLVNLPQFHDLYERLEKFLGSHEKVNKEFGKEM